MTSRSTFRTACVLGIVAVRLPASCPGQGRRLMRGVQVYCVSMYPLLLTSSIGWAKPAVAVGAVVQVCFSYIQAPLKACGFVGAIACGLVVANPVASYFLCCAAYGIFYASFLNQVQAVAQGRGALEAHRTGRWNPRTECSKPSLWASFCSYRSQACASSTSSRLRF